MSRGISILEPALRVVFDVGITTAHALQAIRRGAPFSKLMNCSKS